MLEKIPTEHEAFIRDAVRDGHFASPGDALKKAIQLLRDTYTPNPRSHVQASDLNWEDRFRAVAAQHRPTGQALDDSRESMYGDRS